MKESRINLTDNTFEIIAKMAEGNPGALTVCIEMVKEGDKIDPDSFAGGLGAILLMDTLGIYAEKIWMLYKDVCKESIENTLAVLRACQLGIISEGALLKAIVGYGEGLEDVDGIVAKVKEKLPRFGQQTV
jgi:hypothetical protein